jgi:cell volume regulation protein A
LADTQSFALLILLVGGVGLVAVLSSHLTSWVRIPSPALFLVFAAVAVKIVPALHAPPEQAAERVVTIALVCILFDGGMHIGWSRLRSAAAPIAVVGVAGTFLTVAAGAVLVHLAFNLTWFVALLVATAVAPTDPAVVFSVLGQREISGRSGTILEGEAGANDPVGIALMTGVIAAGGVSGAAFAHVGGEFILQMGVGGLVGVVGGRSLLWFIRRVPLPSEGLYPLRTLVSAFVLFAVATLAHGSGFLAVFVAGIILGDEAAPYKREIPRPRPYRRPRRDRPRQCLASRAHPRGRAGLRDQAGHGRTVPDPSPVKDERAIIRPVCRPERRGAHSVGELSHCRARA